MANWTPKDPDAVLDYSFTIPLDDGDAVSTATLSKLSGDVVIDSQSLAANVLTAWLSGGTDGETTVFKAEWTTDAGREADAAIYLPIAQESAILSAFRRRFAAFAAIADADVQYWLDEGIGEVAAWNTDDQPRATLLYAAHKLAEQGLGANALPGGVTSFKSGTFSASISDAQAMRTGFDSTVYGREYLQLARRSFGGPRLAWTPNVSVG